MQIESITAVDNIDKIFTTSGIDAFMIGPYDLSGSLGKPGDFDDSRVKEALQKVMDAARRHNMPAGFHSVSSNPEEARRRREEGFSFLAFGIDSIFLGDAAYEALSALKGE